MTSLKLAYKKLSASIVLLQWFGNLVLMLLAFAWLQIPDSHTWQFLLSMFAGAFLVLAFLGLHARTFRKLRSLPPSGPLWQRLAVLLAVIALGCFLLQLIRVGRSYETLLAGYWNSKFSSGQRSFFTFQRLTEWQDHFYDLLQWLLAALLLPVAFVGAGSGLRRGWSSIRRIYQHLIYWLIVVVFGLAGSKITSLLVGWTPGHGTAVEILSVFVRLGLAYTLDILLWCFLLALIAVYSSGTTATEPQPER
jgi:hypothetical protein